MSVECIHWESAGIAHGGGCKIQIHGAYLVSFSKCSSCQYRTLIEGPPKRTIRLQLIEESIERAALVKPICNKCQHLGPMKFVSYEGVFEDLVNCKKCHCALKIISIYQPCPEGYFK